MIWLSENRVRKVEDTSMKRSWMMKRNRKKWELKLMKIKQSHLSC